MKPKELLSQIIEDKYKETLKSNKSGMFEKINNLKPNAIGQVGEKFVKTFLTDCLGLEISQKHDEIIHKPFDISVKNGANTIDIEIKTAQQDKNEKFQFNNIKPNHNCKYIVCMGITANKAFFNIIDGKINKNNKNKKIYLNVNNKRKLLTAMNPKDPVSFKLTLKLEDLEPIENFESKLRESFGNALQTPH